MSEKEVQGGTAVRRLLELAFAGLLGWTLMGVQESKEFMAAGRRCTDRECSSMRADIEHNDQRLSRLERLQDGRFFSEKETP